MKGKRMKDFAGKIAVVTGGGTGMGRELARQLIAEGCSVAMCDVSTRNMAETIALCQADGVPQGARVTAHLADVSDESQLVAFRDEAAAQHETDKLHLLFNNAGIGGGGSMVVDDRAEWERTFNVCWGGVYLGVRTFLPMLQAADEAHIVNTSSVNGFWASLGPNVSHTAYAAAKFAVKGFSEALITDLALNAPHIKVSVVMPGHIGTSIVANSRKVIAGRDEDALSEADLQRARTRIGRIGIDVSQLSDQALQAMVDEQARRFLEEAPTTAAAAATIILDGVKAERWRILVGDDAQKMDAMVRKDPEAAYSPEFYDILIKEMGWRLGR
jgi:NAD(P)-dependent dehydrogenase (short-subunit alcohol dehydrogenase family)